MCIGLTMGAEARGTSVGLLLFTTALGCILGTDCRTLAVTENTLEYVQAQDTVISVTLQRDTISALTCPLKSSDNVTWVTLTGGQTGVPWRNALILPNVEGPVTQLYRCQQGKLSYLFNVTLGDPVNDTQDTEAHSISHCIHGRPCALACPGTLDKLQEWPGLQVWHEVWWGEEWTNVYIKVYTHTHTAKAYVNDKTTLIVCLTICNVLYRASNHYSLAPVFCTQTTYALHR